MIENIIKNDFGTFEGKIKLDSWNEIFDTTLDLMLSIDVADKIEDIHKKGFDYIIDNQKEMMDVILQEIFEYYEHYKMNLQCDYEEDEVEEWMPDLEDIRSLIPIIKPRRLHILNVSKNNLPYIGVQLNCSWDEEHGVGIMLWDNNIVSIGGSDASFMNWIAENHKKNNN